jgi:hypothetical protein
VVFIPGIMGSVLVDAELHRDQDAAEQQCRSNLGPFLDVLSDSALIRFCEEEKPEVVWGKFGMLHWLLRPESWMRRLMAGNGIDRSATVSGDVKVGVLPASHCPTPRAQAPSRDYLLGLDPESIVEALTGQQDNYPELASLDVNMGLLGALAYPASLLMKSPITEDMVRVQPYADFLNRLCTEGADLLVFPYDWRLSNVSNAARLAIAIHNKWWPRLPTSKVDDTTIPEDQRVTIIAHSMGGLLARSYIEAEYASAPYIRDKALSRTRLAGHRYVRQLITVGTPHLGVPLAYASFVGATQAFEEYSYLKWLRRMSLSLSMDVTDLPLSRDQQRELIQHFAGVIEMFPIYEFMPEENTEQILETDKDFRNRYRTYAKWEEGGSRSTDNLLHSSGYWGWRMLADFRQRLIHPAALDRWLIDNGLTYVVISNDDYSDRVLVDDEGGPSEETTIASVAEWIRRLLGSPDFKYVPTTVTAYDPNKRHGAVITNRGDGVVPWKSAAMYPYGDRAHHIQWLGLRAGWTHHLLMQTPTVQDVCAILVN